MIQKRIPSQFICISFIFLHSFICAAQSVQASLIPKEVYVGDEAEIRFEFSFAGDLFSRNTPSLSVVSDELTQLLSRPDYTIKKLTVSGNAPLYTLSIFFIPWKTGNLDIEAFDLASVCEVSAHPVFIDVPSVQIQSISEKTGEKNLRPAKGPLIVPGTTYIVFLFCALILIAAAVLIAVIMRFSLIRAFLKSFFARIFSSRNYLKACRELLFLEKEGAALQADIFCMRLSQLIRNYLEKRFSYPFTAKTSGELTASFSAFFAYSASEKSYEYIHELYEVCARCDYIRFCGIKNPDFSHEERLLCVKKTRDALVYFEQPEEPAADNTDSGSTHKQTENPDSVSDTGGAA